MKSQAAPVTNQRTIVQPPGQQPWLSSPADGAAWTSILKRARRERARRIGSTAFLTVVRTSTPNGPRTDVALTFRNRRNAGQPHAIVLGSHTQCDFRPIPNARLRDVLLLMWAKSGDHPPAIEAFDLGRRAEAQDASCHESLRLRVGDAEVIVLHAAPNAQFPDAARETIPLAPSLSGPRRLPHSNVPVGPTRVSPWLQRHQRSAIFRLVEDDCRIRTLQPRLVVVEADHDTLLRGLLLGRYSRCDRSEDFWDDQGTSRVHAMLLVRRDRLWAIDLASSAGTRIIDATSGCVSKRLHGPRRMAPLSEQQTLRLSRSVVRVQFEDRAINVKHEGSLHDRNLDN